ncbi:glycosyltransferase family 2 protein [Chitinophaga pinensis]|uniref:Glycosyl transferase family 2 n=1 Tax=Chitinophaga pinensis (strain ATCC 43595 / DSM 2588 / LMG 13176 / NBRC 15968 / NCIMB 11800 / UQM 2034) TaxID=485918 RepID=A0A979G0L5_CHIPD|nr:glycosyltransferase [Chitinophaga pinensis]ACU58583.1 glycosyl transferase family 2 [Chitinophaga pinensis DSM 2588]
MKVSVIIPAYNVEKYIEECVMSVIEQTLSEIEIIVVNDQSSDGTLSVLEKIKASHSQVALKIISQQNQGLSGARNTGIQAATGEYICFLDGDDWLEKEMLQDLYKVASDGNAEVVICDYTKVYEDRNEVLSGGRIDGNVLRNRKDILEAFLTGNIVISACNKMFRRTFVVERQFRFPVGYLYEDLPTVMLIADASVVIKVDKSYYNYRQRSGSIMNSISPKMVEKIVLVKQIIDYIKAKGEQGLEEALQSFYLNTYVLQLINQLAIHGNKDTKQRDQYFNTILSKQESRFFFKKFYLNHYINTRDKIGLFLLRMSPTFYAFLYRKYKKA